jgi:hypothetical protein
MYLIVNLYNELDFCWHFAHQIKNNEKEFNGIKWHIVKFILIYPLKKQNWLQKNYYAHKSNLIIVIGSVKQCGTQIK